MNCVKNPTKTPGSFAMKKRIGSTTFVVNVHFNNNSGETLKEKSLRLMKNDLNCTNKNGKIKPLQACLTAERSSL